MSDYRVFARLKSKAGSEATVRDTMKRLAGASKQEAGAIFYEVYETLEKGEFLVNESYRDEAAFAAHLESEHFKEAAGALGPVLDSDLTIWKTAQIA